MSIRSKKQSNAEALNNTFGDYMLERRTAIPAVVTKVDIEKGSIITIDARPVIHQVITDDDGLSTYPKEMPIIGGIPFVVPWSKVAGLLLSVPINIGDEVLLIFADRGIDNWQFTGKPASPAETVIPRTHDLTDAIAIPGIFNNVTAQQVANYDSQSIELRDTSGKVSIKANKNAAIITYESNKITVDSAGIDLESGASSITMTESTTTIASTNIVINGNITLAGATLNIASLSSTTSGGDIVTSGGVNLGTHVHSDPHGGNTGPPQN